MKFKLIYNSNFPAHRWHCKHLKYLDRLDVLTETLIQEFFVCRARRAISPIFLAHTLRRHNTQRYIQYLTYTEAPLLSTSLYNYMEERILLRVFFWNQGFRASGIKIAT